MGYISYIRKKIGKDPIYMPFAGGCLYEDGKILLQKRKDDGKWAFHGGCVEFGETFEQAFVREMEEELNIKVKKATPIGVLSGEKEHRFYPNQDEIYGMGVIYMIEEYEGTPVPDNEEVGNLKWFSIDDLPKDFLTPDIHIVSLIKNYLDGKSMIVD